MKADLTQEQIKEILDNAPEGAEFYTGGYPCEYRKLVHGEDTSVVYGFLDEEWVVAVDQDIARERIDKGWYLPNLAEQLDREPDWCHKDLCLFEGKEYYFVGLNPVNKDIAIIQPIIGKPISPLVSNLYKPETPEQKAAREREEAAIHIHDVANEAFFSEKTMDMPDDAGWEFADEDVRRMWLAVVDLTGYRKESK